jgi:hypothetical protein
MACMAAAYWLVHQDEITAGSKSRSLCSQRSICADEEVSARASHWFSTTAGANLRTILMPRYNTNKSSICPRIGMNEGMSWIGLTR